MKRHPILFTGPMVRAIQSGQKTQTRRLHRRYAVGDVLWVKETWAQNPSGALLYRADYHPGIYPASGKWKPSIFMPAKASRIDLVVTEVRAQRLQEISEEDAEAEGATEDTTREEQEKFGDMACERTFKAGFHNLWNSLNSKPGRRWEDNPMVWAYTFRRVK